MGHVHEFPPIGMSPSVWGPIFWNTMHIVSLGYSHAPTQEEKASAIAFYKSLVHMIPCPICKTHYSQFLQDIPVEKAVTNRNDLIQWVFDLHNKVNVQLGKPEITFAAFVENMKQLSQMDSLQIPPRSGHQWMYLLGAFLVVGIAGIVRWNLKK